MRTVALQAREREATKPPVGILNLLDVLGRCGVLRFIKVDDHLEVQPELRLHAERAFKAHRGIGRHGPLALDNFVQARLRDADLLGEVPTRGR